MIHARSEVLNPDTVSLRITLEMTVSEWKTIAKAVDQTGTHWPGWKVSEVIGRAIRGSVAHLETAQDSLEESSR